MRQKEFIKRVGELGYSVEVFKHKLIILSEIKKDKWIVIGDIQWNDPYMVLCDDRCFRGNHTKVVNLIMEFISQPVKDRVDLEKKYRLILNTDIPIIGAKIGDSLGIIQPSVNYDFSQEQSSPFSKKIFTQAEIDALPFDMALFTKEEVQ